MSGIEKFIPQHNFNVGDTVTASTCGRADNVQFTRHNVTGVIEKLMGAGVAFRDDSGALYFTGVKTLAHS